MCGTTNNAICYHGGVGLDKVLDVHGFLHVDWVGCLDHGRSKSEHVLNLFGRAISWMRKKQVVVALSTTKVEYMAATHSSKEAVWLHRFYLEIGFKQQAVRIDCNSESEIFLAKNHAYHSKTKHLMFSITL